MILSDIKLLFWFAGLITISRPTNKTESLLLFVKVMMLALKVKCTVIQCVKHQIWLN